MIRRLLSLKTRIHNQNLVATIVGFCPAIVDNVPLVCAGMCLKKIAWLMMGYFGGELVYTLFFG
jgi:Na+/H+ antiporter NhaD/arsenite permease-like protein